jgi:hypothetical protein
MHSPNQDRDLLAPDSTPETPSNCPRRTGLGAGTRSAERAAAGGQLHIPAPLAGHQVTRGAKQNGLNSRPASAQHNCGAHAQAQERDLVPDTGRLGAYIGRLLERLGMRAFDPESESSIFQQLSTATHREARADRAH